MAYDFVAARTEDGVPLRVRDELLNGELVRSVLEARVVIAPWVEIYSTIRPHRGLGYTTPAAFCESLSAGSQ